MTVDTAWIFDIDGVVTNPTKKKVKKLQILDHIAKRLQQGEPVIFNTGRSLPWTIDRVINQLLERVNDKRVLENLFAAGEKGGTWLTFGQDGKIQQHKDGSISIPSSLQQKIKDLIEQRYSHSMFYDETKQTMISIEMHDNYDLKKYKKDQEFLKNELKNLLREYDPKKRLKLDPTTIAIDIEDKHVGKGFALERILNWLKQKKTKPKKFTAIGDSKGDIKMAEKLHEKKLPFEFIFVGSKSELRGIKSNFPATYTQKRFDEGTLEYLNSI